LKAAEQRTGRDTPAPRLTDVRVREVIPLIPPEALRAEIPVPPESAATVVAGRAEVEAILRGEDDRLLAIVGPCSIHDPEAAREYAERLAALRRETAGRLAVLMRVYFEKPRTTIGWKGLINDPHLDGTSDIELGLRLARRLLVDITRMGLPAATEFLDPIVPRYLADLVSWAAVGARTTESQTHREMASGLSMPVGFKNTTDGTLQVAIEALTAARSPHSFLGIDAAGRTSIIRTAGNPAGHLVLRGGRGRSNYDPESIAEALARLQSADLPAVVLVDCSHANSGKVPARQEEVWQSVVEQRRAGTRGLIGVMLESHLHEGQQPFPRPREELRYGVSITDACLGWDATERLLREGGRA
jgi:3-deoxy-7-phosphoheptulonate synthase